MSRGRQPYSEDAARASGDRADDSAPGTDLRRPVIATVTLLLMLGAFFAAGIWQLDRAVEKEAILERFSNAADGNLITEIVPDEAAQALRFRQVRLTGRYQPDRQILLDNMTAAGRSGYQVLTPFVTGQGTVLINRGWVPADPDRAVLPAVPVDDDMR
ncbi:MAG: SURF1 family protein, partial [Gammaproteobacteria bacterium]|nr:SURF1 family protein [Gammaproteobacteria bacterium]